MSENRNAKKTKNTKVPKPKSTAILTTKHYFCQGCRNPKQAAAARCTNVGCPKSRSKHRLKLKHGSTYGSLKIVPFSSKLSSLSSSSKNETIYNNETTQSPTDEPKGVIDSELLPSTNTTFSFPKYKTGSTSSDMLPDSDDDSINESKKMAEGTFSTTSKRIDTKQVKYCVFMLFHSLFFFVFRFLVPHPFVLWMV